MKAMKKWVAALLLLVLAVSAVPAFAEDSHVSYQGNADSFVFVTGSEYSPIDLFPNFKNVIPGDKLTQMIDVRNDSDTVANLYLRSLGADEACREFLSQLTLSVTQNTQDDLFKAPASETAGLTEWVLLGRMEPGTKTTLTVQLEVPFDLDNTFQGAVGRLDWEFLVEEVPETVWSVRHYQEQLDGTFKEIEEDTETFFGLTGDSVSAVPNEYHGFHYDVTVPESKSEGVLSEDGSLVLRFYYLRNIYTLRYRYTGDVPAFASELPGERSYRYGQQVTIADMASAKGYVFSGWTEVLGTDAEGRPEGIITFAGWDEAGHFAMPGYDLQFEGCFVKGDEPGPSPTGNPHKPKTGDTTNITLWIILMAAAVTVLLVLLILYLIRRHRDDK